MRAFPLKAVKFEEMGFEAELRGALAAMVETRPCGVNAIYRV